MVAFGQVYLLFPLAVAADGEAKPPYEGLSGAKTGLQDATGISGGLSDAGSLTTLIANGINVVLGVLGILFLIFVIYAGFLYLTDQGEGKKAEKAKKLLLTAVIGLVLIIAAFAISNYVIGALSSVAGVS